MRPALRILSAFLLLCIALLPSKSGAQPTQFTSSGMGGGGALFSPSFSPHNPGELFVSCDMSELFHSTDLGESWKVEDFRQIMGGNVTGNVQFTGTPSTLYTIDNRNDAPRPVKSIDGGSTWHPINDPTGGEAYYLYADTKDANRLLVTDFAMPGMTGAELIAAAQALRPDLPVILLSGYVDLPDGQQIIAERVSKPFTESDLARGISAVMKQN